MTKIVWEDSYSVGNDRMDNHHKILIKIINKLDATEKGGGDLVSVFESLNRYVAEHFREEERLLKKAGYAELEAHLKEHAEFEKWLHNMKLGFRSSGTSQYYIGSTINEFLREWLLEHILKSDMAYKGII